MSLGQRTLFGLALVLSVAVSTSARAENGLPSDATLSAMGLGGMTVLSDAEGMAVRGQGYKGYGGGTKSIARAFGSSFANYETKKGDAHSENGYFAEGKHAAKGSNLSYAGEIHISTKPKKGGGYGDYGKPSRGGYGGHGGGISIKASIVFAGGNSSAWAF